MSAGSNVRERLKELDVRPSKRRGQNFLLNNTIAQNIVEVADFPSTARVLEIGPGLGALTGYLIAKYNDFSVIEIEESFCNALADTFPKLRVLNADVLTIQLTDLGDKLYIISNLPYSVSTDVLLKLIYERKVVCKAVLLLQREFAERFAAKPGSKQFGSLSVLGQLIFDTELGPIYQGGSFFPAADVESRVLKLTRKEHTPSEAELKSIERILRASFGQRRKQIIGSLSTGLALPRAQLGAILTSLGLSGAERPEELAITTFQQIAAAVSRLAPAM